MDETTRKFGRIFWNESRNLILGICLLFLLLILPAGGMRSIVGPGGGIDLIGRAFTHVGGQERQLLGQYVTGILKGSIPTLLGTGIGALVCVGLALVLTIAQEITGRGRLLIDALTAMSAIPSFIWWVVFVFLGSIADPPWMFVKAENAFPTPWRFLVFCFAALFIIAISNGSFMSARQAIETEMKRLRGEPFVIAARARGMAGWRFYTHHLAIPAIAVDLERLGGILGNCLVAELLMNIPGLSWQGKQAYGSTGPKYVIVWGLIAIVCLVFIRLSNVVGRFAMMRLDPRVRRPAFGSGTT